MKLTSLILKGLCISVFLASNCYAIELELDALKDPNSMVPKSYAKVVKDDEGEKIIFSHSLSMYGPVDLNNILEAYGMTLTPEALKDPNSMVPKSYAKVVKNDEGEQIIFNDSGSAYGPIELNNILEAYGATLTPEALKDPNSMIPKSYAKVVKNDEGEQIIFKESSIYYCPECLNHILVAYK